MTPAPPRKEWHDMELCSEPGCAICSEFDDAALRRRAAEWAAAVALVLGDAPGAPKGQQ